MFFAVDEIYCADKQPNNATLSIDIVGAYARLCMTENDFSVHFSKNGIEIRLIHMMDIKDIDKLIHYLGVAKQKLTDQLPKE